MVKRNDQRLEMAGIVSWGEFSVGIIWFFKEHFYEIEHFGQCEIDLIRNIELYIIFYINLFVLQVLDVLDQIFQEFTHELHDMLTGFNRTHVMLAIVKTDNIWFDIYEFQLECPSSMKKKKKTKSFRHDFSKLYL